MLPLSGLYNESLSSAVRFVSTAQSGTALSSLEVLSTLTTHPLYNLSYRLQSLSTPTLPVSHALSYTFYLNTSSTQNEPKAGMGTKFDSERFGHTGIEELALSSGSEGGFNSKYSRFADSLIDYDYRTGNYFGR